MPPRCCALMLPSLLPSCTRPRCAYEQPSAPTIPACACLAKLPRQAAPQQADMQLPESQQSAS